MIALNCAWNELSKRLPIYNTENFNNYGVSMAEPLNWIVSLILIFFVILAIVIAVRCNPKNTFWYGLLAFLFSEIYLIQFAIRKFLIREKNYCVGVW